MPSPQTRAKSRRISSKRKLDYATMDTTGIIANSDQKFENYEFNITKQLDKLRKNAQNENYEIEYKNLADSGDSTSQSINVVMNSGAYLVFVQSIESMQANDYLGGIYNVKCLEVIKAKEHSRKMVHTKLTLEFRCNMKSCLHQIMLHCHQSTQKLQIQGKMIHKNISAPYFYLERILIPYIDGVLENNLERITTINNALLSEDKVLLDDKNDVEPQLFETPESILCNDLTNMTNVNENSIE